MGTTVGVFFFFFRNHFTQKIGSTEASSYYLGLDEQRQEVGDIRT